MSLKEQFHGWAPNKIDQKRKTKKDETTGFQLMV